MADNINTQLQVQPGETIDAYKARVASMQTPSGAVSSAGFDPNTVASMMKNTIGSVSSSNDTIDASISAAIQSQKEAAAANAAAIESQYGREAGYLSDNLQNQRTSMIEGTRGGAYGGYALQAVDTQIEKSLRDLEQRKNELVLQGNAAAASKISDLQVQQLQFKQQAQQQVFSNLLAMGNYGLQKRQVDLASEQQDFQEQSAISTIALRYGLEMQPGETIDSITFRAKSIASQEEQLNLEKARQQIMQSKAETAKANAESAKILQQNKFSNALDFATIDSLARASLIDKSNLAAISNPEQRSATINRMVQLSREGLSKDIQNYIIAGKTREEALTAAFGNPLITDTKEAFEIINKAYDNEDKIYEMSKSPITLSGLGRSYMNIQIESYDAVGKFLFENRWNSIKSGDFIKDIIK